MRILHVIASHRWTGAAEPAARLAHRQADLGHEILLAATAGASLEEHVRELGVPFSGDVPFERSYLLHRKLRDRRALAALIQKTAPDVVHAHLTHDHMLSAWAMSLIQEKQPVLVRTFHREGAPRNDLLMRHFMMPATAGVLGVSAEAAGSLQTAFSLSSDRVAVDGGGIDADQFRPVAGTSGKRGEWGVPADAVVIGLVSRLRVARGVAWLLDAAEKALPENPNLWLVICGRGNYADEMVERLKTHPARQRIHYAGYVDACDLLETYNAFDAALMLKPGNDGTCRAGLEAMACGRPLVGGDMGAIRGLLAGGECGWPVRPDDISGLAGALARAATDADGRREKGEAARRRVEEHYTDRVMARRILTFYEGLGAKTP